MDKVLIGTLVFGLLFGGLAGSKLSNLNPFSSKNKVAVETSDYQKRETFRDKVKGIEHTYEERSKNKIPHVQKETIGQKVGRIIDNFIGLLIISFIFGILIFVFTGINIFNYIKKLTTALRQTVKGIDKAKTKLNGQEKVLKDELSKSQDAETKKIVGNMKND